MFFSICSVVSVFPISKLTIQDYYYCWNIDNVYCLVCSWKCLCLAFCVTSIYNLTSSHQTFFLPHVQILLDSAHLNQIIRNRNSVRFRAGIMPILDIAYPEWCKLRRPCLSCWSVLLSWAGKWNWFIVHLFLFSIYSLCCFMSFRVHLLVHKPSTFA